jgi:hypothetical protein
MLTALLTGAVAGLGTAALGADWRTALGERGICAAPLFAGTAWAQLSDADEPSDDVVGDLAGLLEPDVSVMAAGGLDGSLVWLARSSSGVTSLEQLARAYQGKVAAVPSFAVDRADGLPGLELIYGTQATHVVEDDPVARAALVTSGKAAFCAVRKIDYPGTDRLVELDDPSGMTATDPVVLGVNAAWADADPKAVLELNAVLKALTDADLVALQRQVAGGSARPDVAHRWLAGKGLVK